MGTSQNLELLEVVFFFTKLKKLSLQLSTGDESAIILEYAWLLSSFCYLIQVFWSQQGKNTFSLLKVNNIQEKKSY